MPGSTGSWRELLDVDVDLVAVTSPPARHLEQAVAVLGSQPPGAWGAGQAWKPKGTAWAGVLAGGAGRRRPGGPRAGSAPPVPPESSATGGAPGGS